MVRKLPIERKPYVSLNAEKRLEIEQLFKNGYGIEETAAKVDISYTSLYRELRLNDMTEYDYNATIAQDNYIERKRVAKIARRKKWEAENATKNNGGIHC